MASMTPPEPTNREVYHLIEIPDGSRPRLISFQYLEDWLAAMQARMGEDMDLVPVVGQVVRFTSDPVGYVRLDDDTGYEIANHTGDVDRYNLSDAGFSPLDWYVGPEEYLADFDELPHVEADEAQEEDEDDEDDFDEELLESESGD